MLTFAPILQEAMNHKNKTTTKVFIMKKNVIIMSLAALALVACQQTKKNQATESNEKTAFQVENCDITRFPRTPTL